MGMSWLMKAYYLVKPLIPRRVQLYARRRRIDLKRRARAEVWPIDPGSASPPENWRGWPDGKRFALVLTHDVDTKKGEQKCPDLMELEKSLGFRSSFNFVIENRPEPALLDRLRESGFEVGIHGLTHDGSLYRSRKTFLTQAAAINRHLKEWGAVGFRSPAMHHNLEWIRDLDIEYDASTFDTDPFEPQSDGMGTIFPFLVAGNGGRAGYVELPYTLPQDFTLFILMRERDAGLWRRKLDWIAEKGGMALLNTHPDYMNFSGAGLGREEYPARYYAEFLECVGSRYAGDCWRVLPRELARFWKDLSISMRPEGARR